MEGHCSTGQSPQWVVVLMEEEEEEEEREEEDNLRGKIHSKYEAILITKGHFYAQSLQHI
jgi:hypothetical protein